MTTNLDIKTVPSNISGQALRNMLISDAQKIEVGDADTANKFISGDEYSLSGYAAAFIDAVNRIAWYVDNAGAFGLPGLPNLKNELDTLRGYQYEFGPESGYLWGVTDQLGKIALGLDTAGNLISKGKVIPATLAATLAAMVAAVQSTGNIACWGDSLTASGWPEQLAALMPLRTVYNGGVGGDTSTHIATRQGGNVMRITVAGDEIPVAGGVAITAAVGGGIQNNRSITGTLSGVAGTLARDGSGNYSFTRATAGAATKIEPVTAFLSDGGGKLGDTVVLWLGRNNYADTATVKADVAACIAALTYAQKRFVVMGVINGNYASEFKNQSGWTIMTQLNSDLLALYPRNFIDIRAKLVRSYNPAIPQDVTDFNNDIVPGSLRTDSIHLTTAGKAIVAQAVNDFLTLKGW